MLTSCNMRVTHSGCQTSAPGILADVSPTILVKIKRLQYSHTTAYADATVTVVITVIVVTCSSSSKHLGAFPLTLVLPIYDTTLAKYGPQLPRSLFLPGSRAYVGDDKQ